MLIPKPLRRRVLNGLHAAHQGVSSMRAYARERLFWPGLGGEIKQVRDQCRECIENAPSQTAEPMLMTPPPDLPFQQVVGDFYHSGGNAYLIYAGGGGLQLLADIMIVTAVLQTPLPPPPLFAVTSIASK